jgi:hypothetical protein
MVHAQAVLAWPLMSKVEVGGRESSYGAVPGLHDCTKTAKRSNYSPRLAKVQVPISIASLAVSCRPSYAGYPQNNSNLAYEALDVRWYLVF